MLMKTTSANICFRPHFEEWLCRKNMYFLRDKLHANATFFVRKNAVCRRNYVSLVKLVSRRNTISSRELVRRRNCISSGKLICQCNWVLSEKLVCRQSCNSSAKTCMSTQQHMSEKGIYANETKFCRQELLPTWIRQRSCRHKKIYRHNLWRRFLNFDQHFFCR